MIWNPQTPPLPDGVSVEEIAAELGALCGNVMDDSDETLQHIAVAVEAALAEDESPDGVCPSIAALASKALLTIGEPRAARRLALLDARVIRPAESSLTGEAPMWVLDLRRLAGPTGVLLELQVAGSLGAVLDCMADVWDDMDGRGVLGLEHLEALPRGPGRRLGVRRGVNEWLSVCAARLKLIGARRGWTAAPDVLALDLG